MSDSALDHGAVAPEVSPEKVESVEEKVEEKVEEEEAVPAKKRGRPSLK